MTSRLEGFQEGATETRVLPEAAEFPEYFARLAEQLRRAMTNPTCVGAVSYHGLSDLEKDISNLQAAADSGAVTEVFMSAASPGVIAQFMLNRYYPSHEDYIAALAEAMKDEYDAIHASGLVLQLDCPDLASWPLAEAQGKTKEEFRRQVAQNVEALNYATRDIPADSMRMHICWGNYEGPHTHDIPLIEIVDLILEARPLGLLFEAANPRHEHEWTIFEDIRLPDGKILIPGVIDSTTNYVEHPELVAQRIERLARLVGSENVIGGCDCGFATFAYAVPVDPRVVWAKLAALAEGAQIVTDRMS